MSKPSRLQGLLKSQSFTLSLVGAVIAAILLPDLGVKGGPLHTESTTKFAVALTFLIQGLSLPTRQIGRSAARFHLHLYCQVAIFVAAPLLMIGYLAIVGNFLHDGIRMGFIYLATLPTTISSAIVMTSSSEGNSSTALFSTTLSNVLGIFVTPILCAQLLHIEGEGGASLGALIGKLTLLVLVPLLAGQLIRPFVRDWANSSKKLFKRTSNAMIVFVVYAAFCQSVKNGIWGEVGAAAVLVTLSLVALFLFLFSGLVWLSSRLATSEKPERIALFFCGSQKTLATGVPMAAVMFAGYAADSGLNQGLIILPLMCYHPLQLFLAGVLSPIFSRWAQH